MAIALSRGKGVIVVWSRVIEKWRHIFENYQKIELGVKIDRIRAGHVGISAKWIDGYRISSNKEH